MRKGFPLGPRHIPHFGHLSGCFHARMRCNAEMGQANFNLIHFRALRGGNRFNKTANLGAVFGLLPFRDALNSITAS
jgi:hypothetical protein